MSIFLKKALLSTIMAKILIKIPDRESKDQVKKYLVKDVSKDFHTEFGFIAKEDLNKPAGTIIKSNTGKEFTTFDATFLDLYKKVKRGPQMIPLKEVGTIIAHCGLGKESIVVEGGSGSGGLACMLANICKEVISYDTKEEHTEIVEKNKQLLNLTNLTLKTQDMTKNIDETNVDAVFLDLPSPWLALQQAIKAVKIGGFIVNYSPNISQVSEFNKQAKETNQLIITQTLEILEREWTINNLIVHPQSRQVIHSGFLTFTRRIK